MDHLINLLSNSFENNHSVDLITGGDPTRRKALIQYCIAVANKLGIVEKHEHALALAVFPEKKFKPSEVIYWNLFFALRVCGPNRVRLAKARSRYIKSKLPSSPCLHLWFLGVESTEKNKGYGRAVLQKLEATCKEMKRDLVVETSNPKLLKFYKYLGYEVYHEWKWKKVDYTLWFLIKRFNQ